MSEFFLILGTILAIILLVKMCFYFITFILSIYGRKWGLGVKYVSENGEFAVITGASGAIGREFVQEFASMGYNLVLISKNAKKMDLLERYIQQKYKENVKKIVKIIVDFTKMDSFDKIRTELSKIEPIAVLVNANGYCQMPKNYWQFEPGTNSQLVLVNVLAPVIMMDILVPRFIQQKHGIVINVGSHSGDFRFPFYSTFSASKSFIHTLTEILATECREHNVHFQTIKPCFISRTSKHDLRSSMFKTSPRHVVYSSLMLVGIESSTYGYWKHKISGLILDILVFLFGHRATTTIIHWFIWLYVRMSKESRDETPSRSLQSSMDRAEGVSVLKTDAGGSSSSENSTIIKSSQQADSVSITIRTTDKKLTETTKFLPSPEQKPIVKIEVKQSESKQLEPKHLEPKGPPTPPPIQIKSQVKSEQITKFPITEVTAKSQQVTIVTAPNSKIIEVKTTEQPKNQKSNS